MIGEQYIKNFQIIRDNYATYETKKMYFDNKMRLSNTALISIILLPIIYVIAAIIIFSFLNLSGSTMAKVFLIGIIIFVFLGILIVCIDYQKDIRVDLFFDRTSKELILDAGQIGRKIIYPVSTQVMLNHYPDYSHNIKHLPLLIFTLTIVNVDGSEQLLMATIDCTDMIITEAKMASLISSYRPIIEWLDLDIIEQIDLITYDDYLKLK